MLRLASPMTYVESLRAPVLLIHGADDTSASVEESRRLERALKGRGCEVELIVVPGAGHVFNFKQPEEARRTWETTLDWLQNTCPRRDDVFQGSLPLRPAALHHG